jgi:hypothetical protein
MTESMQRLAALLLFSACTACASSQEEPQAPVDQPEPAVQIAGGNGASCENAIKILAPSERIGVQAEYNWLRDHRDGYKVVKQALQQCSDRPTDHMTIVMPDGRQEDVYFDISDFFGKL